MTTLTTRATTTTRPTDGTANAEMPAGTEIAEAFNVTGTISDYQHRDDRRGRPYTCMRIDGADENGRPIRARVFAFGERAMEQSGITAATTRSSLYVKWNDRVLHVVGTYRGRNRPV